MADPAVLMQEFDDAIKAFSGRGEIVRKDEFLALDERMRARSFTVARTADVDVIADVYDALTQNIGAGGTWRNFVDDLGDIYDRRGWAAEPWHARIIFEQNTAMANTAGRFEQAKRSGTNYWRFLPSDAKEPRPEHERYYDQVFRLGDGPMPPLDFGCQCGWEPVFDDEVNADEVQAEPPSVPDDQEFQFSPASFFEPKTIHASAYPPEMHDALKRIAANDPNFKVVGL